MCTFKVNTLVLSIKKTLSLPLQYFAIWLWDVSVEISFYICIYSYSKLVGVTDVMWHGFMDNVEIIPEKKSEIFLPQF